MFQVKVSDVFKFMLQWLHIMDIETCRKAEKNITTPEILTIGDYYGNMLKNIQDVYGKEG